MRAWWNRAVPATVLLLVAASVPAAAQAGGGADGQTGGGNALERLSVLEGTWRASGEGFGTTLTYAWSLPGAVLTTTNEVRGADGAVIARYEGHYARRPGTDSLVFWTVSASGELHTGTAYWEGGRLWHAATVTGSRIAGYRSVIEPADGRLVYRAVYRPDATAADVAAGTPLVYEPAPAAAAGYETAAGETVPAQTIVVPASRAAVWRAFTTSEGVMSWASPFARVDLAGEGIWESSYDPAARAGDTANIRIRFLSWLPERMLAMQAVNAPPGFPHPELLPELFSVTTFEELGPETTRVTVYGIGYRDTAGHRALMELFRQGNAWSLGMLRKRFTEGPVDWAAMRAGG